MASATKEKDGKAMATDVIAPGADEPDERPKPRPAPQKEPGAGFFTICKKGQGYWTRMGTAIAAALLGVLTAYHLYAWLPALIHLGSTPEAAARARHIALFVAVAFFVLFAALVWRITNKPTNVDFLIATDSEMKKVNWTTRKELIGSTKVVIFFMILISALLFLLDVLFGYFFHVIKVLEFGPFQ